MIPPGDLPEIELRRARRLARSIATEALPLGLNVTAARIGRTESGHTAVEVDFNLDQALEITDG